MTPQKRYVLGFIERREYLELMAREAAEVKSALSKIKVRETVDG